MERKADPAIYKPFTTAKAWCLLRLELKGTENHPLIKAQSNKGYRLMPANTEPVKFTIKTSLPHTNHVFRQREQDTTRPLIFTVKTIDFTGGIPPPKRAVFGSLGQK